MRLKGFLSHRDETGPDNKYRRHIHYAYTRVHYAYYLAIIAGFSLPQLLKLFALPVPFLLENRLKEKNKSSNLALNFVFVLYFAFFYWSFNILLVPVVLGNLFYVWVIALGAAFGLAQLFGLDRIKLALAGIAISHIPIISCFLPSYPIFALAAAVITPFFVAGLHSPAVIRKTNGSHLGLSLSLLIFTFAVAAFYLRDDPAKYDSIVAQQGVTGVFRLNSNDPIGQYFHKTHIRNISEDCNGSRIFMPGHTSALHGNDYFFVYDKNKNTIDASLPISPDDGIDIDCASNRLFVSSQENVVILDIADGHKLMTGYLPTTADLFVQIVYHPTYDMLYLISDNREFIIMDPKTGKELFFLPDAGRRLAVSAENIFFYSGRKLAAWRLENNGQSISFLRETALPISSDKGHIVIDPIGPFLYLNDFTGGTVYRVDRRNLQITGSIVLQPGLRHLAISPTGLLLLSVNFVKGYLYLIDPETMQLLESLYVGFRARDVKFSHDKKLALIPSSCGGFSVDLNYFERKHSLNQN